MLSGKRKSQQKHFPLCAPLRDCKSLKAEKLCVKLWIFAENPTWNVKVSLRLMISLFISSSYTHSLIIIIKGNEEEVKR